MAIEFTLVEVTDHRLRYLCEDSGEDTGVPSSGTLLNTGVGTPDLRGDASTIEGSPIDRLVSTPVTSQAQARRLLAGETLIGSSNIDVARAHLKITARNLFATQIPWAVDADLGTGPSAGYAVVNVYGPDHEASACYLDIEFEHTITR